MNVTVRRRTGVMALVAVAALVVAAGYLWRFSETGSGLALAAGAALGLVAVAFGLAAGDARTPLLVADETGLRVRLGRDWTGIPWGQVQRVEVTERGRVRDGHVAVLATTPAAALDGAGWRPRLAALVNRWLYDAPFVVPFGPTTVCSVVDVHLTLERLAAGRAPVVDVDASRQEPAPTVVTHDDAGSAADPDHTTDAGDPADSRDEVPRPGRPTPDDPTARPAGAAAASAAGLPAGSAAGAVGMLSSLAARPARRTEVTVPYGAEPATLGMLALSEPHARRDADDHQPEREHLRSLPDDGEPHRPEPTGRGNVALIIDATTDLSRRAMSKVRRPAPPPADPTDVEPAADEAGGDDESGMLLIGGELARARQRLGLTVDDLAERTRIRPSVIEAIEVDDFGPAGGDFYARGHLRMLARVLGIGAEELLTTYDEHFATNPVTPRQVFEVELASGTTGMVRGTRGGSRWGGLVAAVLVLMIVWGVAQWFVGDTGPRDELDVPRNAAGLGSPGAGNPPPADPEPVEARVRLAAVGGDSRVVVWDGSDTLLYRGVLQDGASRRVVGQAPLRVAAADGGVVEMRANGRDRGLLGEPGERSRERVKAPGERTEGSRQD